MRALRVVALATRGASLRWLSSSYNPETMSILRNSSKEVFLVGTAHVSRQSAQQVRDVIEAAKPDAVVVELCEERANKLRARMRGRVDDRKDEWEAMGKLVKGLLPAGGGNLFEGLLRMFYRMFQQQGADPGGEFKAAMEECDKRGILLIHGDRDVRETMRKMKENFTMVDLMKILGRSLNPNNMTEDEKEVLRNIGNPTESLEEAAERMKTRKHVQQFINVARRNLPEVTRILIDERDEYLCDSIIKAPGKRIVAVVGMAHMEGIAKNWERKT